MNRITITGTVIGALIIAAPAAASHRFTDVPTGHPHHDAIGWAYDEGLTAGCTEDRFCPDVPVTRGQMATFLFRNDLRHSTRGHEPPPVRVVRSESQHATCPDGTTLIGGGFIGDRQGSPFASFPNGDRWEVWSDVGATVYAICMG